MAETLSIPLTVISAFLLVLARIAGAFVFVPLPGFQTAPPVTRIVLILAVTISLHPVWPASTPTPESVGAFIAAAIVEAVFGLSIGLVVGFISEGLTMFGQLAGFQAGFSFASTIDPSTQADSTVLSTLAQTLAGLLFLSLGLHRTVINIFAGSLSTYPPGSVLHLETWQRAVTQGASTIFSTGLRLALPVIALLLMVDIVLALVGRINNQLQLMMLAYPIKLMGAIVALSVVVLVVPGVYSAVALQMLSSAAHIAGR